MGRGSASSQVGLFSTQISEQIVRLRAVATEAEGPSDAQQVDLRRAVMATRLLAGSARILGLDPMQQFLDELLAWLQSLEQTRQGLTTTQSLILESVIELEESLLLHLDEAGADGDSLQVFVPQIEDLLGLIRHNLGHVRRQLETSTTPGAAEEDAAEEADSADEESASTDAATGAPSAMRPATGSGKTSDEAPPDLHEALDRFEDRVHAADVAAAGELLARAEAAQQRIVHAIEVLRERVRRRQLSGARKPIVDLEPIDTPDKDPVFGRAVRRLRKAADRAGLQLEIEAFVRSEALARTQHKPYAEILDHLAEDMVQDFRAAAGLSVDPIHVGFELREDQGRARVVVRDDGPRVEASDVLGDTDHLATLSGLRRARALIENQRGLIRVDPASRPEHRFELSLPLDPAHPRYAVLELEESPIAIPAALVEECVPTAGRRFETDEGGESIVVDGRSIPLVDLGQYVDRLLPLAEPLPAVAVIGRVEKRVALSCQDVPRIEMVDELGDAPEGWMHLAYGSIECDGETIPVVDVQRLLELRFGQRVTELSGSVDDPFLDAYETVETQAQKEKPAAVRRALLVNQSEFRRRELARLLQEAGLEVRTAVDLHQGLRSLDQEPVDVVVTDLRLGQEGGDAFGTLRKRHPETRIVLTSSVAREYADELAERTGVDHCWLEPYRRGDLRQILDALHA